MLYRVDGEDLTAIANAIRAKAETTETLTFPQGFADAIDAIQTGGDGTSTILVSVETGSTVTLTHGGDVTQGTEENGLWAFYKCAPGDYTITATKGSQSASQSVRVANDYSQLVVYYVTMTYNTIPAFTYTGQYEVVDDNDNPITTSTGNWKIRFLTSGTFTITDTHGNDAIDVFCVGGGGAGGKGYSDGYHGGAGAGGGYTATVRGRAVPSGSTIMVTIGAGGAANSNAGGMTYFGDILGVGGGYGGASGGQRAAGGNGGSGGGDHARWGTAGAGGSDGSNGGTASNTNEAGCPGTGQGTTTREFGEAGRRLYGGGGGGAGGTNSGVVPGAGGAGGGGAGGAANAIGANGQANTGGGGGGGGSPNKNGGNGGSGIVIIRNARG